MKIALASDHAGFTLKNELKDFLTESGHLVSDFGAEKLTPSDDYPDFVFPAANAVASGECDRGIVIGGDGEGEAMQANRVKGVRCAVFYGTAVAKRVVDVTGRISHDSFEIVKLSRLHNDANMLSLGARFLNFDDAKHAVRLWLETQFSGDPRHDRRNKKLDKVR